MTRLLRGLGALALLLGLVVGFPVLLALWVGWPLPRHVPTWDELTTLMQSQIPSAVMIGVLACLCWLAWANLCVAVTGELVAQIRGSAVRLPALTAPLQHLVSPIVASLVLALSSHNLRHAPARSGVAPAHVQLSAQPARGVGDVAVAGDLGGAVRVASGIDRAAHLAPSEVRTDPYIVRRGDSMWKLAVRRYGAGAEWLRIWLQNRGRAEPNGRHLIDPSLILTGWGLDIPVAGPPAPPARPAAPAPAPPSRPPASAPTHPAAAPTAPPEPTFRLAPAVPLVPGQSASSSTGSGRAPAEAPAAAAAGSSILLPLGGAVGLSLALAVGAAVARARVHERRHWRPGATSSQVDRLVTPTIDTLQRAARATRGGQAPPILETLLEEVPGRVPVGPVAPSQELLDEHPGESGADGTTPGGSVGTEAHMDIDHLSGLALSGPGGESALRALVASMLSLHGEYQVEVTVVGAAAPLLAGVERIPGVRAESDPTRAHLAFEAACLRGGRELLDRGARDCMETAASDWPMDVSLIIVAAEDAGAQGWGVGLPWDEAGRRGVAVLCAGAADGFTAVTVEADGAIDSAAWERFGGADRLHVLAEEEARDVFASLAASRDVVTDPGIEHDVLGAADPDPLLPPEAPSPGEPGRPVDVRLFGRPRILVRGVEVETGVPARGLEVLARLAFTPDGLSGEELLDSLWGEDGEMGVQRHDLNAANSRTRLRLSELAGERLDVVEHHAGVYRIDAAAVDVDLWRFERAMQDARRAGDAAGRRAALERAAAELTGQPLQGLSMSWAEGTATRLRGRALDVLVELADAVDPVAEIENSIALLERALDVNPVAEHVVRRLMVLEDNRGRPETAARVYRELLAELRSLGVRFAEEETERLMEQIRGHVQAISVRGLAASGQAALSVVDGLPGSAPPGR